MSATILAKDPLFGWFAYGGTMNQTDKSYSIIPRDGIRNRFWVVDEYKKIGVEFTRDGFMKDTPIVYSELDGIIEFTLENRSKNKHNTNLILKSEDEWDLYLDNQKIILHPNIMLSEKVMQAVLSVSSKSHRLVLKKK